MFNLKLKNLKSKKGFSLVELMVVVAIMGTLASIAIPAFNEYRRAAKKNAYKADLTSLHKGWLAFGVELDSFCERETSPTNASIINVGMSSLGSSKLYGADEVMPCESCKTVEETGECPTDGDWSIQPVVPNIKGSTCTSLNAAAPLSIGDTCDCTDTTKVSRKGPGKHNFIGFGGSATGADECDNIANANQNINYRGEVSGTATPFETNCNLGITEYDMGVFGHVSGAAYFGYTITNNGIATEKDGLTSTLTKGDVCS